MKVFRVVVGFALGTVIGIALSELCDRQIVDRIVSWVSPFGNVLVAMLKMVVYPIILFSLIGGAAALPLKKSGKIGGSVIAWYLATSLFATLFGIALATLLSPSMAPADTAVAANAEGVKGIVGGASGSGSFAGLVTGLFQNPFSALANGQFLPIIIFAISFGLCARMVLDSESTDSRTRQAVETAIRVCEGLEKVSFRMIDCVMLYFPIGIFALSLVNFAQNGVMLFGPYVKIVGSVALGVVLMITVIYPLAIAVFCRENPYAVMMRLRDPILTAFVTRSSAATLPVSFRAADGLGIDRKLSGFSLPMGATVNMDGVCVHLPVFVILAANMFGRHLGFVDIGALCLSIMFASVGAGGIPGGSVFMLFMVLENMGLSPEQVSLVIALCLGINPILDMFETACNVAGDNVCTYIVARKHALIS